VVAEVVAAAAPAAVALQRRLPSSAGLHPAGGGQRRGSSPG